jgi:excisionase family DNA binding protein
MQVLERLKKPLLNLLEEAPAREAYPIPGATAATGLGRTKLYEEIASGRLKAFRLCGRRLILRQDLVEWLRAARDATAK